VKITDVVVRAGPKDGPHAPRPRLLELRLVLENASDETQTVTLLRALAARRQDVLIQIGGA
jgi:hypothetical protein